MTFAINQQAQGLCYVYVQERGPFIGRRINVTNGPKGWVAQLGEMSGGGQTFSPIGEPQGVSNLINRHDGAEKIAELMGLE